MAGELAGSGDGPEQATQTPAGLTAPDAILSPRMLSWPLLALVIIADWSGSMIR